MEVEVALGGLLLAHAVYTDLRWRRISNRSVGAAGAAGLLLGALRGGGPGFAWHLAGAAAGLIWWVPVAACGLGPGDAKLAMALGAVGGPGWALSGPAAGFVLCGLCIAPWAVWRAIRRQPWRGIALPMAPWLAAGTMLAVLRPVGR